jgi:hypothetical protein
MGLYGVESTYVNDQVLGSFRAAVLDAVGPHTPQRCGALVFKNSSFGADLDPDVNVLLLRVVGIRRYVEKCERGRAHFKAIHDRYIQEKFVGIAEGSDLAGLEPAPPSGHAGRGRWAAPFTPKGPVGLLLHSLHQAGAALDNEGFIRQMDEVPLQVFDLPINHLKNAARDVAIRARERAAGAARTHLDSLQEIDTQVLRLALAKGEKDDRGLLNYLSSGGAISNMLKTRFDYDASTRCPHCQELGQDIIHTLWRCPELE